MTAREVVAALVAQGFDLFAYCPGSRDAPFAYALAEAEQRGLVSVNVFVDERGAGFWAVGAAKTGRRPAVITTSGTAVAELHPALEEARHSHLPLVAVTADRPAELVGVGASQATWQDGLLGDSVLETVTIPAGGLAVETTRRLAVRALMQGGPVHLNVALRDPLTPTGDEEWPSVAPTVLRSGTLLPPSWHECVQADVDTLVIAGDGADLNVVDAALLAGIPVLAEPTVARGLPSSGLIATAPPGLPEQVVITGRPTLSRATLRLAAGAQRKIVVSARLPWPDPTGNADVVVGGLSGNAPTADPVWSSKWARAAELAQRTVAEVETLGLVSAASEIWRANVTETLWLGASNTVRAFDLTAPAERPVVYSNRGLAGIDGTISSGLGASAAGLPVRVVLGDLTFVHDLNALASEGAARANLQVIVLDDGGGSIFASLEHGQPQYSHLFERFFATPQIIDPVQVARGCGWEAVRIATTEQLRSALMTPVAGNSLLHVVIPRPTAELLHIQETFRECQEASGDNGSQ